jgi:hypothetical protein
MVSNKFVDNFTPKVNNEIAPILIEKKSSATPQFDILKKSSTH